MTESLTLIGPLAEPALTAALGLTGRPVVVAGRLTGGFVLLVVGPTLRDGANVVEDGFAAMLTPASWATVRDALRTGRPANVPAEEPGKLALAVESVGPT